MKKISFLFFIIVLIVLFSETFNGCEESETFTSPTKKYYPPCTEHSILKILAFEYDFMGYLPDINANMHCLYYLAAINEGFEKAKLNYYVYSFPPGIGTENPRIIINTGNGSDIEIRTALADYVDIKYNDSNSCTFGYLIGIDRLSNQGTDTSRVGMSWKHYRYGNGIIRRWSAVYTGKMKINGTQHIDTLLYINAVTFHELSHNLLGLLYPNISHTGHGGVDSACCIQYPAIPDIEGSCITLGYKLCDNHVCWGRAYADSFAIPNDNLSNNKNFIKRVVLGEAGSLNNNFDIKLYLNKSEYVEGEPVWLTVKVKNKSLSSDSISFFYEAAIARDLNVKNSLNQRLIFLGGDWTNSSIPYTIFQPGEEKTVDIQLLYFFGNNNDLKEFGNFSLDYYLTEGKYKVSVLLDQGKITSDEIQIIVQRPENDEAKAFEDIKNIYRMPTVGSENNKLNKLNAYFDFTKKYPGSVYMENALYNYSLIIRLSDLTKCMNEKYFKAHKNFISNNPNSFFSFEILGNLANALMLVNNDEMAAIDYLNEVKNKYPNTKVSDAASIILSRKTYK